MQSINNIQYINQDGEIEIRQIANPWKGILTILMKDNEKPLLKKIVEKQEQKQFFRNMSNLIQTYETISFQDVFINYLDTSFITNKNMKSEGSMQTEHRQEPTTDIEFEIDNKKSDDQMHQIIESVETENHVDDLLQVQQQHEPQHSTVEVITVENILQVRPLSPQQQQLKSSDSSIKMVDIYEQQTQFEQSVFSEIEGQNVEQIAAYEMSYDTLDLEQMHANSVKKFDTFRGGTEFIYNPSPIIFSESDDKTMETIMFGAQTAKQFQINGQKYQEDMKDNPNSGVKRKTQKFQIEEDKVIEAYVTHWQELENYIRVQQWQELEHAKLTGGEDHNFRHGAEKQPCHNNYTISSNSTNSV